MKFDKLLESRRVRVEEISDITEKTVAINRVVKVVKGGRRFSFSALVVSGDGKGHVGFGLGKAGEVPDALRKATECSKKSMIKVPLRGTTIPHDLVGTFGATKVIMKPAAPGTGVIAGSAARAVIELSGIKDIRTKVIGSTNEHNVLHAVMMGLLLLKEPGSVAAKRGHQLEEIGYVSAH
jgi:small subunit ribosomal protein S5